MGIPLLYPWANRLGRSRFTVAGREVNLDAVTPPLRRDGQGLPMHGQLSGIGGWQVTRHDGGVLAATFAFGEAGGLTDAFPFPHTLTIEATLDAGTLTIATTVDADAGGPVPIAFGYHPYLRLPGVDRAAWEVEVPVREALSLDDRMLPTGERVPARSSPDRSASGRSTTPMSPPPTGAVRARRRWAPHRARVPGRLPVRAGVRAGRGRRRRLRADDRADQRARRRRRGAAGAGRGESFRAAFSITVE